MNNLIGGLILKNPSLSGFLPVLEMIKHPNSRITLLTASTSTGFIFLLNVNESDSNYKNVDGTFVTSFIIKIVVIEADRNKPLVSEYQSMTKFSESAQTFLNEAKIQQSIWIKTIENGSTDFTPSIANFVLFNNQNAHKLIGCLYEKLHSKQLVGTDVEMMMVINYLVKIIYKKPEYELGVITMPTIHNNVTLYKYIQDNENNHDKLYNAYSNAIASVIRLFLFYKVFHFDLNSSNILIITDGPKMGKTYIIDFGGATDIMISDINDPYLPPEEKSNLNTKISELLEDFRKIVNNENDNPDQTNIKNARDKMLFINDICEFLRMIDNTINQRIYAFSDPDDYQMQWIDEILYLDPKIINIIFLDAFEILKNSEMKISIEPPTDVQEYIQNNVFQMSRDRDISSFYDNLTSCNYHPDWAESIRTRYPDSSESESESKGGKNKIQTKKSKKSRKSRKSKKSRKSRKSRK